MKFKFHADHKTTVACHYAGAKSPEFDVQPASRSGDIILPEQ